MKAQRGKGQPRVASLKETHSPSKNSTSPHFSPQILILREKHSPFYILCVRKRVPLHFFIHSHYPRFRAISEAFFQTAPEFIYFVFGSKAGTYVPSRYSLHFYPQMSSV